MLKFKCKVPAPKVKLFNRSTISVEMKFVRKAAGCTIFYHKRNEENLEELKVEPFDEKLRRCKSNWLQHVTRTNNRMPEIILNCIPNGRRRLGRPLKRLFGEAETGLSRPNSRRMMMMTVQRSTTWPAWTSSLMHHAPLKLIYVGNSISKLQIQVATYFFELSAGNCHR